MDWRLIAAVSAVAGSFCFVAVGAYVVFTHNPAPQRASVPAPMLLSEYRFPAAATSASLVSVQPTSPSLFASQGNSTPLTPAVTSGAAVATGRPGAPAASTNPPRVGEDFNK